MRIKVEKGTAITWGHSKIPMEILAPIKESFNNPWVFRWCIVDTIVPEVEFNGKTYHIMSNTPNKDRSYPAFDIQTAEYVEILFYWAEKKAKEQK